MLKVTSVTFLHHSDVWVELQQLVFSMSTCLNTLCCCRVIGWCSRCCGYSRRGSGYIFIIVVGVQFDP